MDSAFDEAVRTARAAWLCHTTVADTSWSLRQLHGLHDLLIKNRDELIGILTQGGPNDQLLYWEQELASLVEDLAVLISYVDVKATTSREFSRNTRFGHVNLTWRPKGVSLIISNSDNPLRFGIAALAASIAARNTVLLVTTNTNKIFEVLRRESSKHLDQFALHITTAQVSDIKAEDFDDVYIIDTDSHSWSAMMKHPHVSQHEPSGSFSIAVIDDGKLEVAAYQREIFAGLDYVDAIFVHENHFDAVCDTLRKSPSWRGCNSSDKSRLAQLGCQQLASSMFTADLCDLAAGTGTDKLLEVLQANQIKHTVSLIKSTSLDQVLDAVGRIQNIGQAVLINPASEKSMNYFQAWIRSSAVSLGCIRTKVPPVMNALSLLNSDIPTTNFPVTMFAKPRFIVSGNGKSLPEYSASAIRKSYENKVPDLEPEHPGGRVDFFVQVEYVIKAVGTTLAVLGLVGAWYASKAIRRKWA